MPKQAKRRFVGLSTEEVSLVDSPANEVEFLVTKNHREKNMGANAATKVKKERVSVEVDGDEDDTSVTKALQHVNSIVDKIVKMVPTTKADEGDDEGPNEGETEESPTEGDDGDDESDATEDQPVEKALSIKALLAKCGMEGTALKSALIKLKAAGVDPSGSLTQKAGKKAPPFLPAKGPKGAKKPTSTVDEEDDDEDDEKGKKTKKSDDEGPLTMAGLADAVQKAAAFTPARIKALQNAQETLKLVLEAVTPGHSPETNTPAMRGQHSIGSELQPSGKKKPRIEGTLKSADAEDELITTLKSLSGAVGNLCERVEAIEKARSGSNSADDEGTTDSVKKSKTLWSGVL